MEMEMAMEISFPGGKKVAAAFQGFMVMTDQPERAGGAGSAPAPFDYFLASIGTCAGIYVLGFCEQRGIPTAGLRMVQRAERDPETHMVTKITMEIRLPQGFPEQYRAAVIRAAEHCAVKKHLHSPPAFDIYTTGG